MFPRGKVVEIDLFTSVKFNERLYLKAVIEIDHVNKGLDKKTKKINKKNRSNFSIDDVLSFLLLLNDLELVPVEEKESLSFFVVEVPCPIINQNYGKLYRLIFSTQKYYSDRITVITLYRI
ncbi:MAG: hypothetical protein H7281_08355 [Bacteriovorax sp.]|nr:hypothetical protein [Bacteriovorax sp.]